MSQVLKLEYSPEDQDWIGVRFSHNERFLSFIKYGLKPESYRRWNPDRRRWEVYCEKLLLVVSMGRRFFNHVDYSSLPERIQITIAKHAKEHADDCKKSIRTTDGENPYQVLHLLPSAPFELVQSAYKTLAFLSHPDKGGDKDQFQRIDAAYRQLKKLKESHQISSK